jgi:CRISPR-associated protein Cas6
MTNAPETGACDMVDIAFGIEGAQLPAEYPVALWEAVARVLPWLEEEPLAGIHTLKTVETNHGVVLLPKRARLTLRVPAARSDAAEALAGSHLDVAGFSLEIGEAKVWQLVGAGTLYADFVTTGSEEEDAFCRDIKAELADHGIVAQLICGRARSMLAGARRISGFALALHGISKGRSGFLQQIGLGKDRRLGCGILVQHKAITGLD